MNANVSFTLTLAAIAAILLFVGIGLERQEKHNCLERGGALRGSLCIEPIASR